ncbi:MAG: antibiotic biosynthesis monooxygenase [Aquabacterium sp.]
MIAVIFEVAPHSALASRYFELAETLKPSLMKVDGFIAIERFESLSRPGHYLSLSFWRDEAAIQQWRRQHDHRQAQAEGRAEIFADYRLRVAHVIRDYGLKDRTQAPEEPPDALG